MIQHIFNAKDRMSAKFNTETLDLTTFQPKFEVSPPFVIEEDGEFVLKDGENTIETIKVVSGQLVFIILANGNLSLVTDFNASGLAEKLTPTKEVEVLQEDKQ